MGLFNKNQSQEAQPISQRQLLEGRYVSARRNILWVLLFTTINLILLVANKNHAMIHDLLAGTVVVDYASQRIFRSTDELIEYQKKIAAERAARQTY